MEGLSFSWNGVLVQPVCEDVLKAAQVDDVCLTCEIVGDLVCSMAQIALRHAGERYQLNSHDVTARDGRNRVLPRLSWIAGRYVNCGKIRGRVGG